MHFSSLWYDSSVLEVAFMQRLNSRLEAFLKEIAPYNNAGAGPECVLETDCFEEVLRVSTYLEELEKAGILVLPDQYDGLARTNPATRTTVRLPDWFSLTSEGEGYFDEVAKAERAERKRRWSERRWQLLTVIASVLLSAVVSLLVTLLNDSVHLA